MIENRDYKNIVGYEIGDRRYDHVGEPQGPITKEVDRCNKAPNTIAYMNEVITKHRGKDYSREEEIER